MIPQIMQIEKNTPLSLYETIGGKTSLAEKLNGASVDKATAELKSALDEYLQGLSYSKAIPSDQDTAIVIANAATLARFKVEAIEIIMRNESIPEAKKTEFIDGLFGKETLYSKLYDDYYTKENCLVARAQKVIKQHNIQPLFDGIIPSSMAESDFDLTRDISEQIREMRGLIGFKDKQETAYRDSFLVKTKAFDQKELEVTMLSLMASDPRKLGALLAMMGNKDKNGEILFEKDTRWNIGGKTKLGSAHSALRCLVALAICAAFMVSVGAIMSVGVAAAGVATGVATSVKAVTAVTGVVTLGISLVGFHHIAERVKEEQRYSNGLPQSPQMYAMPTGGLPTDGVLKYVAAPTVKGRNEDHKEGKSEFEIAFQEAIVNPLEANTKSIQGLDLSKYNQMHHIAQEPMKALELFGIRVQGTSKSLTV